MGSRHGIRSCGTAGRGEGRLACEGLYRLKLPVVVCNISMEIFVLFMYVSLCTRPTMRGASWPYLVKRTSAIVSATSLASWKQACSPPTSKQNLRKDSGAWAWARGYSFGSRSLRLRGGLNSKGGNCVVVVVVVVTTVVVVAGAIDKCAMV
jgi:hypothetical protein